MSPITVILLSFIFIVLFLLKVKAEIIIRTFFFISPLILIFKVFATKSKIYFFQLSSNLENILILLILYSVLIEILYKDTGTIKLDGNKKLFLWSSVGLFLIYLLHNLIDFDILFDKYWLADLRTVSPWSIVIFIAYFGIFFLKNVMSFDFLRNYWEKYLLLMSIIFITLYFLTFSFLIDGNIDKSLVGSGGVGLNNFSTNETGFFSFSLGISWFYLFREKIGLNRIIPFFFISILFLIVILTKSRISAIVFFTLILGNIFIKGNKLGIKIFILSISLLALFFVFDTIVERFNYDYRTSYNYLLPEIPFTGSGRTIIWYYFLNKYINSGLLALVFGVGDVNIIRIYDSTPLKNLGAVSQSTQSFLPLHSEIIDILISAGIFGFLLFLLLILSAKKNFVKSIDFNLNLIVLLIFMLVDMLVYNVIALFIFGFNIILFLKKEGGFH